MRGAGLQCSTSQRRLLNSVLNSSCMFRAHLMRRIRQGPGGPSTRSTSGRWTLEAQGPNCSWRVSASQNPKPPATDVSWLHCLAHLFLQLWGGVRGVLLKEDPKEKTNKWPHGARGVLPRLPPDPAPDASTSSRIFKAHVESSERKPTADDAHANRSDEIFACFSALSRHTDWNLYAWMRCLLAPCWQLSELRPRRCGSSGAPPMAAGQPVPVQPQSAKM